MLFARANLSRMLSCSPFLCSRCRRFPFRTPFCAMATKEAVFEQLANRLRLQDQVQEQILKVGITTLSEFRWLVKTSWWPHSLRQWRGPSPISRSRRHVFARPGTRCAKLNSSEQCRAKCSGRGTTWCSRKRSLPVTSGSPRSSAASVPWMWSTSGMCAQ